MKIDDAQPDAMNAHRPCAAGFEAGACPARPNLRNCRPQQMKDRSLEHPPAGRAATQSA